MADATKTDDTAGSGPSADEIAAAQATVEAGAKAQAKADEAPYYCPGCGRRWAYLRECEGKAEAGHPPILVVSTDELDGEPDPADKDAHKAWADKLTAAPNTDVLAPQ